MTEGNDQRPAHCINHNETAKSTPVQTCDSELMTLKEEKAQRSFIFCSFNDYTFQTSLL